MAKQQVIEYENGPTLIYQKRGGFNGCSFVIGFRSGAQLDGKYRGLSHLLEHLMFRSSSSKDIKQNVLNDILRYSIGQNAFTSENVIISEFSVTNANVEFALENCMNSFLSKKFNNAQIKKEIDVIKHEIDMYKEGVNESRITAYDALLSSLQKNSNQKNVFDLSGNARSLNQITPEILKKYVERYFNLDNLIISVTSNQSLQNIQELLEKHVFSRLKNATSSKYIVPFPKIIEFHEINGLYPMPVPNSQNISIDFLIRERVNYSENIDKEYAYDAIEERYMNSLGGALYEILREKNSLVYLESLTNENYGLAKFKHYNMVTNRQKMRKTIRELCYLIRDLGENGIPQDKFDMVKDALIDIRNASLNKFKTCSAQSNFNDYMSGVQFVDYKKASDYIKNMTYEDFNNHIKEIYGSAQVSVAVDGSFDARKLYNIVEIEEMLGNYSHSDQWFNYNMPSVQFTAMPDIREQLVTNYANQVISQYNFQEQVKEQLEEQAKGNAVTIDNEKVK